MLFGFLFIYFFAVIYYFLCRFGRVIFASAFFPLEKRAKKSNRSCRVRGNWESLGTSWQCCILRKLKSRNCGHMMRDVQSHSIIIYIYFSNNCTFWYFELWSDALLFLALLWVWFIFNEYFWRLEVWDIYIQVEKFFFLNKKNGLQFGLVSEVFIIFFFNQLYIYEVENIFR